MTRLLDEIFQFPLVLPSTKMPKVQQVSPLYEYALNETSRNLTKLFQTAKSEDFDSIQNYYFPLQIRIQNDLSEKSNSNSYQSLVTDFRTTQIKIFKEVRTWLEPA